VAQAAAARAPSRARGLLQRPKQEHGLAGAEPAHARAAAASGTGFAGGATAGEIRGRTWGQGPLARCLWIAAGRRQAAYVYSSALEVSRIPRALHCQAAPVCLNASVTGHARRCTARLHQCTSVLCTDAVLRGLLQLHRKAMQVCLPARHQALLAQKHMLQERHQAGHRVKPCAPSAD